MVEDNDDINRKKADIYSKSGLPVHIVKKNGEWCNGVIQEVSFDFFFIDEYKKRRMVVFFIEVAKIEPFIEA